MNDRAYEREIESLYRDLDNQAKELDKVRSELAAERERAGKYQRISAQLSDTLNGTPCAEIRWQQERDELRAELAACKEQLHLTNIDWFQAEAERDALLALLRSAVMQLPEHRRARFEDALKGDGDE